MVKSSCSPHPGPHHEAPHCFMYRCKETHTQIQFFFTIRIVLQLDFGDFPCKYMHIWASQVALVVKNPPANARDLRDLCSIPESGRFPWRRKRQLSPVFLPRESHGQGSLVGYSPWGLKQLDMTVTTHACMNTQPLPSNLGFLACSFESSISNSCA